MKTTHEPTAEGGFRTGQENEARLALARSFERAAGDTATRLDDFPNYVRRQRITRLIALYELFKLVLPVKGSIIECGVFRGFSLSAFAHFSAILEPTNLTRRIYGFDTFAGFPEPSSNDANTTRVPAPGDLRGSSLEELQTLYAIHDTNRY